MIRRNLDAIVALSVLAVLLTMWTVACWVFGAWGRNEPNSQPAPRDRRVTQAQIGTATQLHSLGVQRVTRYCATGHRTRSGPWPAVGMVATLDRSVPFGTRVWIDGLGTFTVADWIGTGSDWDIFTTGPTCASDPGQLRFGVQQRRVAIVVER